MIKKMMSIFFALLVPAIAAVSWSVVGAQGADGKYDTDGDGLIEITHLEQLDAIRYDHDGDGIPLPHVDPDFYYAAFPGAGGSLCNGPCAGYELARSLDFNDPDSYASGEVNPAWTSGEGWTPLGGCFSTTGLTYDCEEERGVDSRFASTFEGNGHTISNLYINRPNDPGTLQAAKVTGLFRVLFSSFGEPGDGHYLSGGIIANVGLINAYVTGDEFTGALVGSNRGRVIGSYATGVVSGVTTAGGLVGLNDGYYY